ncbi:MAG: PD40 domain-containing protein [Candidatus Delongbacteria bacterium]|nr:PD40 domain-containing protein [Candidatus Delongbacteria bacterium]
MKHLRTIVSVWCVLLLFCGTLRSEPAELVVGGEDDYCMQPQWSPDGEWLAFTSMQYQGIQVVRPNGSERSILTQDAGAGFRFNWHPYRHQIVARANTGQTGPYRHAIRVYGLNPSDYREISAQEPGALCLPQWVDNGNRVAYLHRDRLVTQTVAFTSSPADSDQPAVGTADKPNRSLAQVVADHHNRIGLMDLTSLDVKPIDPLPGKECLNAVTSPDGEWLAFEELGGHLYVRHISSGTLHDCGWGNRPAWSPDSRYLVFMKAQDDGHQYLSSDLYLMRLSDRSITPLTETPDRMEMNPAWSPKGDEIAFNTYDKGMIYRLKVSLP